LSGTCSVFKGKTPQVRRIRRLNKLKKLTRALLDEVEALSEAQDHAAQTDDDGGDEEDFYKMVEEYEKLLIRRALVKARGNQAQAARMLRLKPTTLNHKMKAYQINADRKAAACGGDIVSEGCPESPARRQAVP
jgi:DNA-binding NtrC family response regulator